MSQESLQKLVTELDVLIRARYPLIAANTHEEGRFKRVINGVAQVQNRRIQEQGLAQDKKDREKGLYLWSRTKVKSLQRVKMFHRILTFFRWRLFFLSQLCRFASVVP